MEMHRSSSASRGTSTTVTCSRCKKPATVPFTPTPGRPVYCRECFARSPASGPAARATPRGPVAAPARQRQRMLSQRRKGHFVHDALAVFEDSNAMDEQQRRTFVEMVFARGSRQDTQTALDFISEKQADDTLTPTEALRLARVVEQYSLRR